MGEPGASPDEHVRTAKLAALRDGEEPDVLVVDVGGVVLGKRQARLELALGSAANPEGTHAAVAVSAEPVGFTLVVSPDLDRSDLTNLDPGELTMAPPTSRSNAREALATQLADEMDAIATRQALLARHRLAIPASPPSDDPERWTALDLREELERLNARFVQDLPTAAAGAAIDL